MPWTIYASAYLEMLIHKFKSKFVKCDLQSMIAPLVWCFDTYPILSIIVLLIGFAYAVPICLFLIFAIVTFVVTFAGFLFLEGVIIAVAFFLLLSVLSTLTIILALFLFTCWTLYIVVAQLCQTLPLNSFSGLPPNDNLLNNNHLNRSVNGSEE